MRDILVKKQQLVEELAEKMQTAVSLVAFDYPGLTVAEFTELRIQLKQAGCDAKVYKNNPFAEYTHHFVLPLKTLLPDRDRLLPQGSHLHQCRCC